MRVEIVPGDITRQDVEVVVNAANPTLVGGGGVDGAIHRAAGPRLLRECRRVRKASFPDGLPVGRAVATGGGNLKARWVVHTVGPNWHRDQRDPELLASCVRESIRAAAELGARSIAFPAVSAGAYGWDVTTVARIMLDEIRAEVRRGTTGSLERVRLVPFGADAARAFTEVATGDRSVGSGVC